MCGANAAPMPRHRSASTDLRSTTANYRGAQAWWPVHQLSSTNYVCVPRAPPLRACVGMPPPFFPPGASSVIALHCGHWWSRWDLILILRKFVCTPLFTPTLVQIIRPESPDAHLPRPSPPVHACNHWASDSCNEHKDPQVGIHRPNLQPNPQSRQTLDWNRFSSSVTFMDSSSPPQPRRSDRPSGPTSCLGCRNCTMCLAQVLRQCSTLRGGDGSIVHRWWKIVWCEAQRSTKSKGRMHSLQMLHCACRALATILKCEQNFQVRACPRFGCSFPDRKSVV